MRSEMVHAAMERFTKAYMSELDQLVEQGLLSTGTGNCVIGNGGLGFVDDLPQPKPEAEPVIPGDLWGATMAQIFSEVSPDMHKEFALDYESRFLKRAGLCYYGCCEPLHHKIDIVAKHIPHGPVFFFD